MEYNSAINSGLIFLIKESITRLPIDRNPGEPATAMASVMSGRLYWWIQVSSNVVQPRKSSDVAGGIPGSSSLKLFSNLFLDFCQLLCELVHLLRLFFQRFHVHC